MGEDLQLYHQLHHHIREGDRAILPILRAVVRDEDGASLDGDVLELDVAHLIGPDEAVVQDVAGQQEMPVILPAVFLQIHHGLRRNDGAILLHGSLATESLEVCRWIHFHKAVREQPFAEGPEPSDIIVPGPDRESLVEPQPVHKTAKEPAVELVDVVDWHRLLVIPLEEIVQVGGVSLPGLEPEDGLCLALREVGSVLVDDFLQGGILLRSSIIHPRIPALPELQGDSLQEVIGILPPVGDLGELWRYPDPFSPELSDGRIKGIEGDVPVALGT